MKMLWTLIKKDLLLNYSFLQRPSQALKNKKRRKEFLSFLVAFLLIVVYTVVGIRFLLKEFDTFVALGIGELFLGQGFLIYTLVLLIFSVASIVSQLYFSSDVSIMLRLPISHESIFASKIFSLSLTGLFYACLVTVPLIIRYGMAMGEGFLFYLYALLQIIFVTLLTISLLSLVIVILMRFANRIPKIKSILQFLGMLVILGLTMGFQIWIQKMASASGATVSIPEILQQNQQAIYTVMPHLRIVLGALTGESILMRTLYGLGMFLAAAAAFFIALRVGTGFLIRGISDNRISPKKHRKVEVGRAFKKRSVAMEIARKDLNDIFRTPVYLFNIGLIGILLPLFMVIPLAFNSGLGELTGFLPAVLAPLKEDGFLGGAVGMGAGVLLTFFICSMAQGATTTFTREGKNMWLMETLPITYRDQVKGRIIASFLLSLFSLAPTALILIVLTKPSLFMLLGYVISSTVACLFMANGALAIDIRSPKLQWDNPQKAVKQNVNVVIYMLATMIYIVAWGFLLFQLGSRIILSGETVFIAMLIFLALHLLLAWVLYRWNIKTLKRKMPYGETL